MILNISLLKTSKLQSYTMAQTEQGTHKMDESDNTHIRLEPLELEISEEDRRKRKAWIRFLVTRTICIMFCLIVVLASFLLPWLLLSDEEKSGN